MMWLLNFLPDAVIHLLTVSSILALTASFVFGFIPFISQYKFPVQVVSTIVLAFSLYLEGAISNEEKWALKVKDLETQIAKQETKSAEVTTQVITKYITKDRIIKEKGDVIVKEIPKYITEKSDSNCDIPNGFVLLHDSAAKNEVPDTSRGIDEGTSNVKISTVAETVVINYTTYHELKQQLLSLQEWIKEQNKVYNK